MCAATILLFACSEVSAQASGKAAASRSQITPPAPVVAPQVNPVVHRLSGLKLLNYLRRSGASVATLSDETFISDNVQTSIAAGLWLDDKTIVARLPRAELEVFELTRTAHVNPAGRAGDDKVPASIFVIQPDGNELALRFMGFDGGTGISLLQSEAPAASSAGRDAKEESLIVGQRVRLLSPDRAPQAPGVNESELYVQMGELVGNVMRITRGSSGKVARITVTADNFSSNLLGGIAVNDAGETIGLIEANRGKEVEVIPIAGVHRAAERIRHGLENRPRPWLGARGSSLAVVTREQLEVAGWRPALAAKLMARQVGVVLTSVPPQTPAWLSNLRTGDVVVRVNGSEVKSAEDFSSMLTRMDGKRPLEFTVMKPGGLSWQVVSVRLNESPNPMLEMEYAEERAARLGSTDPFVSRGIESLPVTSVLAARLGARAGRYVVFVHPSSSASTAGIRAGDVIETLDGELLSDGNLPTLLQGKLTLGVIRGGQKLEFKIDPEISGTSRSKP